MYRIFVKCGISFRLRSAVYGFVAVGLFFVCIQGFALTERTGGLIPSKKMTPIKEAEGDVRMTAFRNQRMAGDYCFRFQLIQKPRRGRNVYYYGTMWGSWNKQGPVSRILFNPRPSSSGTVDSGSVSPIEMIVQSGVKPSVWLRKNQDMVFERVQGEDVFKPIIDGVLFRPFDLQMPFVYWNNYKYEGPARLGNVGHVQLFKMYPPQGSAVVSKGIKSVRIALDDTYDALRRVEIFGAEGKAISGLETRSFRKVQGQWIVKDVSLKDYRTRDRANFLVKAAAIGIDLNASVFNPESLDVVPLLEETKFKVL